MNRASLLIFATFLPSVASAATSVGFALAVAKDLPDVKGVADFGPSPALHVPVRVGFGDRASFRTTLRIDTAFGNDQVTWGEPIPSVDPETPAEVRFQSDTHSATLLSTGITFGVEASAKPEGWTPFIGAEVGPVLASTSHSFSNDPAVQTRLRDPDYDGADPGTSQIAWLTDLRAGLHGPLSKEGGVDLWIETGYSTAFLGAKDLSNADPGINARREAYGFNAVRLGFGLSFAL